MGMCMGLRRISPAALDRLLATPADVVWFMTGEERDRGSWVGKLLGRRPPTRGVWREPVQGDEEIDLDKAWHAIHWLISGSPKGSRQPAGLLCSEHRPLGRKEVYLGVPWTLDPSEVGQLADVLVGLDEATLRARVDPAAMARDEVYLAQVFERDLDEGFAYAWENLLILRRFLVKARQSGDAVIVYLT